MTDAVDNDACAPDADDASASSSSALSPACALSALSSATILSAGLSTNHRSRWAFSSMTAPAASARRSRNRFLASTAMLDMVSACSTVRFPKKKHSALHRSRKASA